MRHLSSAIRTSSPSGPDREPHGYLHIAGAFADGHREDIEAVLAREAHRACAASPAACIIAIDTDTGNLLVSTTTEHLAHRLGRALVKVFGGELHSGFGLRHNLALVWWQHEPP